MMFLISRFVHIAINFDRECMSHAVKIEDVRSVCMLTADLTPSNRFPCSACHNIISASVCSRRWSRAASTIRGLVVPRVFLGIVRISCFSPLLLGRVEVSDLSRRAIILASRRGGRGGEVSYPFNAPTVRPFSILSWKMIYTNRVGIITSETAANKPDQSLAYCC